MKNITCLAAAAALSVVAVCAAAEDAAVYGIPFKPDPPPAIDGRLDEWESVPKVRTATTKEHCAYGQPKWASAADLSARVWLAWRGEYLYLAADVTDDQHRQTLRDRALLRGDHVELYLDLTPDAPPGRSFMGAGQVQFGFSPGNFQQTGDPLADIPAEAVVFRPEESAATGVLVAAQQTDQGYAIEAALPWPLIGQLAGKPDLRPDKGFSLGLEVAVSDTDGTTPAQEKMLTLRTEPWQRKCERLIAAALAGSDGIPLAVVRSQELLAAAELPASEKREIPFSALSVPPGKDLVLTLKARLDSPRPAGYTRGMRLTVNGEALDGSRLVNWEGPEPRVNGELMSLASGETFNVPYCPDFDSPNKHPSYALRSGPKLCRYELRVNDLVRDGDNRLIIHNSAGAELNKTLVIADVQLQVRDPVTPRPKRPAPTGPLPAVRPAAQHKVDYRLVRQQDGAFEIGVGGATFRVESEFSTPEPAWVRGPNKHFDHRQEIQQHDEWIVVRETFSNRTAENLPLMHRHRVTSQSPWQKVWLAGLSPSALVSTSAEPANPTTYGAAGDMGIGVLPLDDVFQVHVTNFSTENQVGLADNQLVLKPGASYTAEWAILPTARGDYFAFLNAVRRLRDVNFTLDGSFAFLRADPRLGATKWSDRECVDFIRNKNAHFVCSGISWPRHKGRYAHGTSFQRMDWSATKEQIVRLRKLAPEAKHLKYYHCFIDTLDEAVEKYADARLLRSDGTHADYGRPYDRLYVPTHENSFGRDVSRNVELILGPQPDGIGCDGVYWDEFEYSRYQYAYHLAEDGRGGLPWDEVSADIDPKTLKVVRLKSAVELISQPFRLALARSILARGPLVANGQPHTRTMLQLHFPRFVETGSISRCTRAQMYSPIALGDHLTERSELDAYRVMLRALDYGCLYYWYNDLTVVPTHPHLTSYMFPATPIELGDGYLIAKERIVTNRSGLFGWGDSARPEVHVFDDQGREVPDFTAPTVVQDGMTFTELRLPEDYSAAIVR